MTSIITDGDRTPVFIVDDQDDVRLLVRTLIDAAGTRLFVGGEAANGEDALDRVEQADPAVIVLDQMMPGMTGLETAAAILGRRPGQRIILFSAYVDAGLRAQAQAVGITACVDKQEITSIVGTIGAILDQ